MYSGYKDKNGEDLYLGDKVILRKDGIEREFTVSLGRTVRTVVANENEDEKTYQILISAIYFDWNGYKLFPIIHEDGIDDTKFMEKVKVV